MSSPRFVPREFLANPERFGRAGADWTGWQHRQPAPHGNNRLPPHVVAAAAWAQHHLAVSLRLALGYPSAADPNANDQCTHADDDWLSVNAAAAALTQFADELGESRSTLTRKLSGSAVAA